MSENRIKVNINIKDFLVLLIKIFAMNQTSNIELANTIGDVGDAVLSSVSITNPKTYQERIGKIISDTWVDVLEKYDFSEDCGDNLKRLFNYETVISLYEDSQPQKNSEPLLLES